MTVRRQQESMRAAHKVRRVKNRGRRKGARPVDHRSAR